MELFRTKSIQDGFDVLVKYLGCDTDVILPEDIGFIEPGAFTTPLKSLELWGGGTAVLDAFYVTRDAKLARLSAITKKTFETIASRFAAYRSLEKLVCHLRQDASFTSYQNLSQLSVVFPALKELYLVGNGKTTVYFQGHPDEDAVPLTVRISGCKEIQGPMDPMLKLVSSDVVICPDGARTHYTWLHKVAALEAYLNGRNEANEDVKARNDAWIQKNARAIFEHWFEMETGYRKDGLPSRTFRQGTNRRTTYTGVCLYGMMSAAGFKFSSSMYQMLLRYADIVDDVSFKATVMSDYRKYYDVERIVANNEKKALEAVEHPDDPKVLRKQWAWSDEGDAWIPATGIVTLKKWRGTDRCAVVPSRIGDKVVAAVWYDLFTNFIKKVTAEVGVEKVIFQSNSVVATIPDEFLYHAQNLSEIVFPAALHKIGDRAFYACGKLRTVKLPDGVICIGKSAFDSSGLSGKLVIPWSVRYIGDKAFNARLTDVTVKGDPFIGAYAFGRGLKVFSAPALKHLPEDVLSGQHELVKVYAPSAVRIGQFAFHGCNKLTEVYLSGDLLDVNPLAFCRCENIERIVFPAGSDMERLSGLFPAYLRERLTTIEEEELKGE